MLSPSFQTRPFISFNMEPRYKNSLGSAILPLMAVAEAVAGLAR